MSKKVKSCTLMEKYIKLIACGKKTTEARVAIPMFKNWEQGDTIRFFSRRNPKIEVITKIVEKNYYKTFREMLENEEVEALIPGVRNIDEAEKQYLKIPNYAEREKQHGVLAFKLQVL